MKNLTSILLGLALLALTGCNDNPELDRRSPYKSGLDYKRASVSDYRYSVKEIDSLIESIDNYMDVKSSKLGDKYWESEDFQYIMDSKRILMKTREQRLAGN
ncbi:MAG: hypothetical protein ACRCXX_01345 [Cetobacterium sp.]|uniref:hypothetical protein n=1 Tax=Cetobacterium sp. TaxID=2071632 RepID=UPI003F2A074F